MKRRSAAERKRKLISRIFDAAVLGERIEMANHWRTSQRHKKIVVTFVPPLQIGYWPPDYETMPRMIFKSAAKLDRARAVEPDEALAFIERNFR